MKKIRSKLSLQKLGEKGNERREERRKKRNRNLKAQSSHRTLEIISTNNPRNPGATATNLESRSLS